MNKAELIAALEAATGPSRELDAEIAVFAHGGEIVWKQTRWTMESYPARKYASPQHIGGYGLDHVPEYTGSLDAALTLLEGTTVWVLTRSGNKFSITTTAFVAYDAPTAPLAVCLAWARSLPT